MTPPQSQARIDIWQLSPRFPEGVYADVRLEHRVEHRIVIRDGALDDVRARTETGALLRVLKAGRWYYASTTDLGRIDELLAELASSDALAPGPLEGMSRLLAVHRTDGRAFVDAPVDAVPVPEKRALLERLTPALERSDIKTWSAHWLDSREDRRFVSSRGADVRKDYQEAGFILGFTMASESDTLRERFSRGAHRFTEVAAELDAHLDALEAHLDKCARFVAEAEAIEPGEATVILAPMVAGVFAHESFGHKSEADFMLGDPAMLEEWKIGTRIGPEMLNIVDHGGEPGSGWSPFDDEGQPSEKTYLIKEGLLTGRLHAAHTAAALDEACTGNARAMSFRFEPIVRMTTTWIEPGTLTREALFAGVKRGYFVESCKHGSGMSRFTIAPSLAWRIEDGVLTQPVRIAVLTGTVFETMGEIDGLSDTIERRFLLGGGCGKMEQWPLSVGFGGPHVRIRRMSVA